MFVALVWFWLMGEIAVFERSGDNYFSVQLNGQEVGVAGDMESVRELLIEARREVCRGSEELVFAEAELSFVGQEVLWGRVDSPEVMQERMEQVLVSSVQKSMNRAYTVKIGEYTVNLAGIEEVYALFQAAIDKYDTEGKFWAQLVWDSSREFAVLNAQVEKISEEEEKERELFFKGGIQSVFSDMVRNAKPEREPDFEDYELGLMDIDFPQRVEIAETYLPSGQLTDLQQAISEVTEEQEMQSVYEVKSGDTLSEIAIKVDIPMDRIVEMNESLENENSTIRVGDELIITVPEPELTVRRVEESYVEEVYDAEIIYVDNDSWYTNQTKVLQQPSAGFRKIIALSTYINDTLSEREILKEEVVMEAVPKIVERGTKIPPTYIKPISGGRLSSTFGKRSRPTKGASTNHKGVDWATPKGTAVFASCGGTVAKAGWGSGYGYVVYINHEDGRQTRYAHLSKVLVKAGQTVSQGQKIALSGNTGVSSGPHLHFEILIGGKQVDPLKYLQ